MTVYTLTAGTRLEALDEGWFVFSALSGDTSQLNLEAAAVLELLADQPQDAASIAKTLAADMQMPAPEMATLLQDLWPQLLNLGLISPLGS